MWQRAVLEQRWPSQREIAAVRASVGPAAIRFATPNEVEAAGTLVGSYAESEMLSPPDIVYLEFKDKSAVQVGASYLVYRTVGKVYHPRSGKFLGYQTQVLSGLAPGEQVVVIGQQSLNDGDPVRVAGPPTSDATS